jgi:hypothetical protein
MPAAKTDLLKRLVRLRKEREKAEATLAKVKAQIDEQEPAVLNWMQENGIGSVKQDGITVHLRRELWASVAEGDIDFLRDALSAAGIDPSTIIKEKANTQTLSALVREFDRDQRPMPNSLAAALKVSEVFKIGYRAS